MTIFQKLRYLLSPAQKRQLFILALLLIVGMFFEMAGLGILIPALSLMLETDIGKEYPAIQPYLDFLGNPSQNQLVFLGLSILIIVYLLKAIFLVFLTWRQSKFSTGLSTSLGQSLFLGYLRQPYHFHLQRNSALLLRNIQTEAAQFTSVSQHFMVLSIEFSAILSVALVLIAVEPIGALVVTVFLGIAAIGFHRLIKNKLLKWGEGRQLHVGLINQHLLQGLGGVKDVKVLGRENYFLDEFTKHNQEIAKIQVRFNTISLIPRYYLELLAVIGLVGLIILMIVQHKPLNLLMPTLGVFVAAAFRMIPSVNRIMDSSQQIRYAQPVVNVLYDEFKLIREYEENQSITTKLNFQNNILIKDLRFKYLNVDSYAIDGVSIIIKKGASIGLIGPSGSGKSTLVDIILGLLAPNEGEINVDGNNIQNNLRGWQDGIGYVPQSIYLTDDTLRRNIAFGISNNDINDRAVQRAIQAAQLDEFVRGLPQGVETFVGERGVRLSGGQRQRIGIARALYHDPQILILDEATSALDTETEKGVMDSVNTLHGNKTIIIVAHRLSTVEKCDWLYRLEKGKIIEEGTPKTVLKNKQTINV
ncbi:ABC transporter ATP-binding protein [Daejeonella sp. H1SJ63]|uniref:ABC transporter ATP-binding protein n=1 Tax=Daejeonella sp. H1SJ63 TaxID=3034145 RepID=UPI0023ED71F3|nr:ABC transporter ATP-binding protein [Daejeonella sp. H1SJ63]